MLNKKQFQSSLFSFDINRESIGASSGNHPRLFNLVSQNKHQNVTVECLAPEEFETVQRLEMPSAF